MDGISSPPLAVFRPALGPICRRVLALFAVACVIGLPLAFAKGRTPEELVRGFLAAGAALSLLVPFLALCVRPLSLWVHHEGLVGRTFWGRRSLLRWAQIAGFRVDDSSGLRLLIIDAEGEGSSLWTRPDVIEGAAFQRLVADLAPPGNPIRRESPSPALAGAETGVS